MPSHLRGSATRTVPAVGRVCAAPLIALVLPGDVAAALAVRAVLLECVMLLSILMLAAGVLATVGVFVANHPVGDNDPFGM